jgi:hypothetical protein
MYSQVLKFFSFQLKLVAAAIVQESGTAMLWGGPKSQLGFSVERRHIIKQL